MTFLNPVRNITFDAHDPYAVAEFWSALTGYPLVGSEPGDEVLLGAPRPEAPGLLFNQGSGG